MTSPCEIILFCDTKPKADNTAKAILNEAKRLEKKYNYYDPHSFLSLLNFRKEQILDSESKTLLQRAKLYYKQTNGIFDITIATIKDLYTTEKTTKILEEKKEQLLAYVGCEHFDIKKNKLYFDNAFTKIDLGGFVKEYAVDRAVSIIKKQKIKSALINFGGDIYALGKKPNGAVYKIGIKNPQDPKQHSKYVTLYNQALTTSASYERNYHIEDKIYSHIVSKEQTSNTPSSVSVISCNCVESGVYSTALMIDKTLKTKNTVIIIDEEI